jgi:thioredoxin reductase (NADPH)
MYDIIIIGAGPAGLTAAIYGRRANKKVLVLEALTYGGQIVNTTVIDNYPALPHVTGFDFATNLYNQAIELGAEVKFEKVINIIVDKEKKVITDSNEYTSRAIIIATGADRRKLGLEKEDKFTGSGISYCATCDGNFFKDKEVAVNGGGNTALTDALYLADICSKVYLIHRRDEFRGSETLVNEVKKRNNIELVLNSKVTKLNGDNHLTSIEVTNNDGSTRELPISCLFVAIGQVPVTENFVKLIDVDDNGYAIAGEDMKTKVAGLYVAGDVRKKSLRQLATAISDGAIAATEAIHDIQNNII